MLNRILVPVCDEAGLAAVIPAVRQLVGGTGAQVHLLAVRPLPRPSDAYPRLLSHPDAFVLPVAYPGAEREPEYPVTFEELIRQETVTWERHLLRYGSQLAYDGIVVRREVRLGDPLRETVTAIQRHAARVVLLAAAQQRWLQRLLRPTLAQRLLAYAPVPVIVVPAERPLSHGVALRYDRLAV